MKYGACIGNKSPASIGISSYNGKNNVFEAVYCTENNIGILLSSGEKNKLINNTCTVNIGAGIVLMDNYDATLTGNACCNNPMFGIQVSTGGNNNISKNNCDMNNTGILLTQSSNNKIEESGNDCNESNNNTVTENICTGKAIMDDGTDNILNFNNY